MSQAQGVAPERLLRLPEVEIRTGLKKTAIYRAMKDGKFPRNVRLLGNRSVAWPESRISAFIESRVEVQA
jgi:prophage regulatory protein